MSIKYSENIPAGKAVSLVTSDGYSPSKLDDLPLEWREDEYGGLRLAAIKPVKLTDGEVFDFSYFLRPGNSSLPWRGLIDPENPTAEVDRAYRRIELPYGAWELEDGRYVLFNRLYRPLWITRGPLSSLKELEANPDWNGSVWFGAEWERVPNVPRDTRPGNRSEPWYDFVDEFWLYNDGGIRDRAGNPLGEPALIDFLHDECAEMGVPIDDVRPAWRRRIARRLVSARSRVHREWEPSTESWRPKSVEPIKKCAKGTACDKCKKGEPCEDVEFTRDIDAEDALLAEMNARHAALQDQGGAFRVLSYRHADDDIEYLAPSFAREHDFIRRYKNTKVFAGTTGGKVPRPRYATAGEWWLAHDQRRQYARLTF